MTLDDALRDLLGEKAEAAAFGPLCRLLLDAEAPELVLGDAITTTLRGIESVQRLGSPSLRVDRDGVGSAVVSGRGRSHCGGMNDNFPVPGCRIERITRDGPERLHVAAHGTKPHGRCPDCGRASRAVHSHYRRCPADLPLLGSQVRVGLRVRRFYCRNTACARQTFAERLPDLVAPHARRTGRLAEAQTRVGVALGGEAGSRLMCRLAMPASAATVLRLVRRPPLPETEPPRAVGVDDWAELPKVLAA